MNQQELDFIVEASKATRRKILKEDPKPRLAPATVLSYTEDRSVATQPFGRIRAVVHMDGTPPNSTMEANVLVGRALLGGDRVMVQYEPPHGAHIVGTIPVGGSMGTGTYPTMVIAAANARDDIKRTADFVCDGVTDDQTINEAWRQMFSDRGPGRLQLSEGDFYFWGGFATDWFAGVGYAVVPFGCTLAGVGKSTRIYANPDTDVGPGGGSYMLVSDGGGLVWDPLDYGYAGGGDFSTIRDLQLIGDSSLPVPAISMDGQYASILDVFCTGFEGALNPAIVIGGAGGSTGDRSILERVVVDGVGSSTGIELDGDWVKVLNCIVRNTTGIAFEIGGDHCLLADSFAETIVTANGSDRQAIRADQADYPHIRGCTVRDASNSGAGVCHGIRVRGCESPLVEDNLIVNADGAGIRLEVSGVVPTVDARVTDNVMRACGLGIAIVGVGVTNAYVVNNDLRANVATLTDTGTATVLLDQNNVVEGDNRI